MAEEGGERGRSSTAVNTRVQRQSAVASQTHLRSLIQKDTRRKKRFSLAPYDDDIVKYNNLRYPPSKIAEILTIEHDLDPKVMNRRTVEGRLRYLKKNSLKTLAPTNATSSLKAVDEPTSICLYF
jgi:hypothetical protein